MIMMMLAMIMRDQKLKVLTLAYIRLVCYAENCRVTLVDFFVDLKYNIPEKRNND